MTPATFEASDAFVLGFDGQKNDRAPGENFATAYGITQVTWYYAIHQGIIPNKPIEDATAADCETIRRALYWNVLRCSSLAPGVNLMVYNDGVLSGTGHAARLLQRIIGADVDGDIGPQTIGLADGFGDRMLIDALAEADTEYLSALASAPLYLNGWLRREREAQALAYQMAGVA